MRQPGFTQIINCCPHKITYYIGMLLYKIPVLSGFFRKRLATVDDTLRIGSMIALIFPPNIVVACHIQILEDSVRVFVPTELASVPKII